MRPDELLSGVHQDAFLRLMQFESDRARRFFAEARQFLPPQDRRTMVSAEIMAAIYWRLLGRIQEAAL